MLTTERIRALYTNATAWHDDYPGTKSLRASNRAEFDEWLADHDAKVRVAERAKIAAAIRSEYLGPDSGRSFDGREAPDAHLRNAYDEGLHLAAEIAEGVDHG